MSIALLSRREQIPPGYYTVPCAVSGGTLEAFLRCAITLSHGQLCPKLFHTAVAFPLPCPSGQGTALSTSQAASLARTHKSHFSEALGTNYLTFFRDEQLYCLLFDTLDSLRYKLRLCDRLGISRVLVTEPELYAELKK